MMDNLTLTKRDVVQSAASQTLAIYSFLALFLPLFTGFYFGAQVDQGIYKRALILSMCSNCMGVICLIFYVVYELPTEFVYLAAFLKSTAGGDLVFLMTSFTFIVKNSKPESAAERLIIAEIICTAGFICGSILSGFLADKRFYLMTLIISLTVCTLCIVYSALLTPDSISSETISVKAQIQSFLNVFQRNKNKKQLLAYMLLYSILFTTFEAFITTNYLFVSGDPFLMDNKSYSFLNLDLGVSGTIIGLIGSYLLNKNLICLKKLSSIALLLNAIGFAIFGVARSNLVIYIGAAFISCFVLILANIKSIMSNFVDKDENGRLFTCIFQCENIIALLIEPISLAVYAATLKIYAGIIYFILAGILGGVVILSLYLLHTGQSAKSTDV